MRKKQRASRKPITEYLLAALFVALVITIPLIIVKTQDSNRESHAASVQPVGQTSGWNMIFSDEFNGPSLNTAVWTPGWFGTGITGPVNSAEIACYDSALATVPGDGSLHLKLIQQQNTCKGSTRPYTGALVSSNGKFQYSYGYVEFRAFLPAASAGVVANWPATWSDGQSWPTDGENDTMEGLGGKACYHFHSPVGGPGGCANGDYTGWHTFGSDWQPGKVTYYYDGVKVGEITSGITSSPQYLIMNNSTDSDNPLLLPADMLVDYVRVWQRCTTDCEPTATPAPGSSTTIVPSGSTWKYLDNNTRPTGWETTGFADSAWTSGNAELGYGDGDESTVVSYGGNASSKYPTTYFRKSFTVSNPSYYSALQLGIKRDDGAIVYINGTEVFRTNMPTGTISHTTWASSSIEDNTYFTASVPVSLLQAGTNIIAIEVHQSDAASSDISMDLTLTGTVSSVLPTNTPVPTNTPMPTATPTPVVSSDTTPPSVTLTSPANGSTVRRGSKVTLTASASDNVGVNRVQFYAGTSLLCTDTTAPYSCTWNVPSKRNVTYTLRATAFDTAGNSSSSSVNVTAK